MTTPIPPSFIPLARVPLPHGFAELFFLDPTFEARFLAMPVGPDPDVPMATTGCPDHLAHLDPRMWTAWAQHPAVAPHLAWAGIDPDNPERVLVVDTHRLVAYSAPPPDALAFLACRDREDGVHAVREETLKLLEEDARETRTLSLEDLEQRLDEVGFDPLSNIQAMQQRLDDNLRDLVDWLDDLPVPQPANAH